MIKKVALITGSGGQLANDYMQTSFLSGWNHVFMKRDELNIVDEKNVNDVFSSIKPDCVINMAAFTDVEKAETNKKRCYDVNAIGPKILAEASKERNIPLIHISTDYVFDGKKGDLYVETDEKNPVNYYGETKSIGEDFIEDVSKWYYILRISWLYGNNSNNFYTTMLKESQKRSSICVVNDRFGSPTSTLEVSRAIDSILCDLDKNKSGIYHFCGKGTTSWKEFAEEIFLKCDILMDVKGMTNDSRNLLAKKPYNTSMSSEKMNRSFGISSMPWKKALKEILKERKIYSIKSGDFVVIDNKTYLIMSTDWHKREAFLIKIDDPNETMMIEFDRLELK